MGWLIDLAPLDYTDAIVALGAGLLGAIAGALGVFAVLRQRSLVGDALAHATLPGVCVAFLATGAKDASTLLIGAALAGLLGAVLMVGIERTSRIRPDAAIGVVLTGFFSLGIVLLTHIAHLNNANQAGLERYLFGQAAGLQERDLTVMLALGATALAVVAVGYRAFKATLFDRDFAGATGLPVRALELAMTALLVIAVIVGVRIVGAILMVAMLIAPAAAARQLTDHLAVLLVLAAAIGAAVGTGGALLSVAWEVPTGPVIVLAGVAVVLACLLLAPGRGVLWRARKLRRDRRRSLTDGVLLDLEAMLHAGAPPTLAELAAATGRPRRALHRALRDLDRTGLLARDLAPRPPVAPTPLPSIPRAALLLPLVPTVASLAHLIAIAWLALRRVVRARQRQRGRLYLTLRGAAAAHALLERRDLFAAWLEHGPRLSLPDAREPDPRDLRASLGHELADELLRATS